MEHRKVASKAQKILCAKRKKEKRSAAKNGGFASFAKIAVSVVLGNCILMMWCSYILAWFDKIVIAESLSSTIADVIVGTIVAYLCSKTVENISKYGSRLNGTTKEQERIIEIETPAEEVKVEEIE